MERGFRDERGLTIVEILAAIVILAIVLISFSSFFLQSTKYTKYNNEKLTAVQVAEEVIADVRNYSNKNVGDLIKDTSFNGYTVTVEIKDGPSNLNKAVITVISNWDIGIKKSPFVTGMYFEVTP